MSTEQDLADRYRRYIDCLNERRLDDVDEFVDDVLVHNGERMTRAAWKAGPIGENTAALPDLRWQIEQLVVGADRLAARLIDTGTPRQQWLGLHPTGASVQFSEHVFYTFRGGRIATVWSVIDKVAVETQLRA